MVKLGDTIKFLAHGEPDPAPLTPGEVGRVDFIGDGLYGRRQIGVKWESGRTLMLIEGVDRFEVVEKGERRGD